MLRIRIGFNTDTDPGSRINADPDRGPTLKSQKIEFLHEITLKALNCKKTDQLPGYYLHILVSSIIRNADPD